MPLPKNIFLAAPLFFLLVSSSYAAQSAIMESQGYACLGEDKSRKQTEQAALADAKRNASEAALTYIKSETSVKNYAIEKDLIDAYANAAIKVIHETEKVWYKDQSMGDCYRVRIKAEVAPQEEALSRATRNKDTIDDPSAPLTVRIWSDKADYKQGDAIKLYIKGNKPFYARVVYRDAGGNNVQLLPNPFRIENYFNGGVVYEIPSGHDSFALVVSPPFGSEDVTVYASTTQVGEISLQAAGGVYQVLTKPADVGVMTRGVQIQSGAGGTKPQVAEFAEEKATVKTEKQP